MEPFILKNSHLEVEIQKPGQTYRRSRFDWAGFITQVKLDGTHTFLTKESLIEGQGTGGAGLCNEFGYSGPMGYSDAQVGEQFAKIGVGLLTKKEDSEYGFWKDFDIEPSSVAILQSEDSVSFQFSTPLFRGYGFDYIKKISIVKNILKVDYFLANKGVKPFKTTEYCHNFLSLDGNETGSPYHLRFPFAIRASNVRGGVIFEGDTMQWLEPQSKEFYAIIEGYEKDKIYPWHWELECEKSGTLIRESLDLTIGYMAVWGMPHVISPEVFIEIDLAPGKEMRWYRQFEFERVG